MRFGLFLFLITLIYWPANAKPGDTIKADSEWPDTAAIKRQVRSTDTPIAPEGFQASKIASNLGEIVSIIPVGNDVFVADADQDRVLRLRSRSEGKAFESRAEYLIGFDQINDLATDGKYLFISDRNGIWKIEIDVALVATRAPGLLYAHRYPQTGSRISIAMFPDKNAIAVGVGNEVFLIDATTGNKQLVSKGKWIIENVAVSPTGGIWASVFESGNAYIMPMRVDTENIARLSLPPHTHAIDIQFWHNERYPESWPDQWASDMIVSLNGNRPVLARAHFNFGDIMPEFTVFIDGFSKPSQIVGRRNYWGVPTAITVLPNGHLVFAEREHGTLWG
ncbi:MAG: hypothetical protein EX271_09785, partial [Acidimicrobiales bacterium]